MIKIRYRRRKYLWDYIIEKALNLAVGLEST